MALSEVRNTPATTCWQSLTQLRRTHARVPSGCPISAAIRTTDTPAAGEDTATTETLDTSAKSLAMHVVAARPAFLDEASAPEAALEKEKKLLLEQAEESGKDPKVLGKMVEGRYVGVVVVVGRGDEMRGWRSNYI